jgi:hypothetical protein
MMCEDGWRPREWPAARAVKKSAGVALVLIRSPRSRRCPQAAVALRASHALSRSGQRCSVAVVHSQSRSSARGGGGERRQCVEST